MSYIRWSPQRDAILTAAWRNTLMSLDAIGEVLGVGASTVARRAIELRLPSRERTVRKDKPRKKAAKATPELPIAAASAWSDGWFIAPPTKERLRAGR